MPSGPAVGWPEQSITRSAPKPPTMSRTALMRCLRRRELLDIDGRLRAELARQRKPRRLRRADADHAPCAHLLRGGDRENADRPEPWITTVSPQVKPPARVARLKARMQEVSGSESAPSRSDMSSGSL